MRKSTVLLVLVATLAMPAFAEWRLDLGVIVPRGAGISIGGETESIDGMDVANWPFIPLPEAGIYYEEEVGSLKFGLGARAFTLILATILWPNAYVEMNVDRLAIQAQIGGGAFGLLTVSGADSTFGNVFIPDISAWYKLGKNRNLRLGGGIIGVYLPELMGDGLPFLFYLGGKVAIPL
jgi:hypothetical protein